MRIAIYGSGGMGRELAQTIDDINAQSKRWESVVFIDDITDHKVVNGCRTIKFDDFTRDFSIDSTEVVIAVGEPSARESLFSKVLDSGYAFATIVHPTASVSPYSVLGEGAIVQYCARVAPNTIIGKNVLLNSYASVGHDCEIGDGSVISSFTGVGGGTTIGKSSFVGIGASIRDHISIGDNSIVSMSTAVYRDMPSGVTVMGNPARIVHAANEGVFR